MPFQLNICNISQFCIFSLRAMSWPVFSCSRRYNSWYTSAALWSACVAGTASKWEIFHFCPLWAPLCTIESPSWGDGRVLNLVWWYVYHRSLTSLFLISDRMLHFETMAIRRRVGSKCGSKFCILNKFMKRSSDLLLLKAHIVLAKKWTLCIIVWSI